MLNLCMGDLLACIVISTSPTKLNLSLFEWLINCVGRKIKIRLAKEYHAYCCKQNGQATNETCQDLSLRSFINVILSLY